MTREEAIELAIKACEETWNEKTCKQIRDALEQEPKTGHWIRDTITDLYHCSECRSICHQDPKSKDDYCKYCGAKMADKEKE